MILHNDEVSSGIAVRMILSLRKFPDESLFNFLFDSAILWGKMEYVREISFTKAEKINLGIMTEDL